MALQTFTIDPAAEELTPDEVIAKINAATTDITRATSIAGAALNDSEVTSAKLASSAARDNLKAMSDTTREIVLTRPVTGEFPVTAVHRGATGLLEVEYDDVAIP